MRRSMVTAVVASAPPPSAPVYQARTTGGVTTGTSVTVDLSTQGFVAGDFILVYVGGSRIAALSSGLTGYTKMVEIFNADAGGAGFLSVWGKFAVGGDSNPSFTTSAGNTNMTYVAERWTGVVGFSSGLTGVNYNTTSPAMTANTVTTTVANPIVLTMIGGRAVSTGNVAPVWGGGAASHYGTASGRIGFNNSGIETKASPGSVTHTCSITNAQASPSSNIGSVILAPA